VIIERQQLKFRPYRFNAVHQLQQLDTTARIHYWLLFRRVVPQGVPCISLTAELPVECKGRNFLVHLHTFVM
jgi:hypothetical protein